MVKMFQGETLFESAEKSLEFVNWFQNVFWMFEILPFDDIKLECNFEKFT